MSGDEAPNAPSGNERRRERTRRRMLDAGERLIGGGVSPEALVVTEVVAEAGVGAGSFHTHFGDMPGYLVELASDGIRRSSPSHRAYAEVRSDRTDECRTDECRTDECRTDECRTDRRSRQMIENLAYVGFVSPAAEDWRSFGQDILGAQLADDGPDGEVRLRVDDRAWRIAIHAGDVDDVAYLGWDAAADGLPAAVERAAAAGLEVHLGDDDLAARRAARSVSWFVDPLGFRHEYVVGAHRGGPFEPGREMEGPFVTGAQGLGHVVVMVPDIEAAERFLIEVLGLVPSDRIGPSIRFYHCAGSASRHHTVAISEVPGMVGLHHIMLEVANGDDVGRALDLVKDAGIPLAMDYGRHPNDLMSSFYVRTPSGFELEYGTGGVVIDDATWQPATYDTTSIWGHRPPAGGVPPLAILRPAPT